VQLSETGVLLPRDTRHWSPSPPRLCPARSTKIVWLGLRSPNQFRSCSSVNLVVELAILPAAIQIDPAGHVQNANIA